MTVVHQVIPVLAPRDAVGNHTRRVRDALRSAGISSEIFAELAVDGLEGEAQPLDRFDAVGAGCDLILYQASTGSGVVEWLLRRSERFSVNYHNITPGHFFDSWAPEAAASMRRARNQLRSMAPASVSGLADSTFNATELVEVGYRDVEVSPLLLDLSADAAPDRQRLEFLRRVRRGAHWLFVGRVAPNKCQHDLVAAFAVYRRLYDPGARLTLVGSTAAPAYEEAVLSLVDELELAGSVTIIGSLSDSELAAYYADADVFVCLSRHEGFCVPVLEAMRGGTPVVALAATAVTETVGAAGMLLPDADPHVVAAVVQRLSSDDAWRARLVAAGHARVLGWSLERTVPQFLEAIERSLSVAAELPS